MSGIEDDCFYKALPAGKWTRTLLLEPGAHADPIRCSLHFTPFQSAEYETLSYVWGSAQEVGSITCQGVEVEARANFVQALRQVRFQHEPRTLWVDALCINQRDVPEKGAQVNMMGEIYSHAKRVIVCFGDDGRNGELAQITFDTIRDFNRIAAKYMPESVIPEDKRWSLKDEDLQWVHGAVTDGRLLHVNEIFKKPWFQRVWVLQEVGVSRDALLAYGHSTINFTEIMDFAAAWTFMKNESGGEPIQGAWFCSHFIVGLFRHVWATYPVSVDQSWYRSSPILTTIARAAMRSDSTVFEDLIFKAGYTQTTLMYDGSSPLGNLYGLSTKPHMQRATDPRDFVHAFLGHPLASSDDGELFVSADYTRSMLGLRIVFFSRVFDRNIRSLGLVWNDDPADLSQEPTWCPHLDVRRPWLIEGRYDASRGENALNTTGSTRPQVSSSSLIAAIYIVDTVLHCGEIAGEEDVLLDRVAHDSTIAMLGKQPSLVEEYWTILEATEMSDDIAFQERALAFAETLLQCCERDHPAPVAKSFGDFCKDHCPRVYSHLEERGFFGRWASTEPPIFIPFLERTAHSIKGQRFFTTKNGYCGTGSPLVKPGDLICIIPSVQPPMIIRPIEGKDREFYVISSSYVSGIMYGEIFKSPEAGCTSLPQVTVARFI